MSTSLWVGFKNILFDCRKCYQCTNIKHLMLINNKIVANRMHVNHTSFLVKFTVSNVMYIIQSNEVFFISLILRID